MLLCWLTVFITLFGAIYGCVHRNFPAGFKFGAATSAYQIEGGWDAENKTPSVWDVFTHKYPHLIPNGSNGDIACNSFNLWRQDVQLAADLGLHFYRISISWTRILPNSFPNYINEAGVKYYNNIIDGLLEKGIEPFITLYHWDLPEMLQDLGGWANPLIAEWFGDFARVAFSLFGDRVKKWITINEPVIMCESSYNLASFAPGIDSPGFGNYLCNKNVLLAHAKAWRIYDEEFRSKYNGRISLTNQIIWVEAQSEEAEEIAELARQFIAGMFVHPIFTAEGGWPPSVEKCITEKGKTEGHKRSPLPGFTEAEKEFVRGTHDFFGLNFYTSRLARAVKNGEVPGSYPLEGSPEIGAMFEGSDTWKRSFPEWFYIYPEGLRKLLVWLKESYGDLEYLVLENGYTSDKSDLVDNERIQYYEEHLEQILLAMGDGVNVTHYTVWSLMDNLEWYSGYSSKFGLAKVDFNDPERKRIPRLSAQYYAKVIASNSLDVNYQ